MCVVLPEVSFRFASSGFIQWALVSAYLCFFSTKIEWVCHCLRVSLAVMKHHNQKQVGEEIAYLSFTSILFIVGGSQVRNSWGRNLEAGAEAEAIEECCLLACSSWLAQLSFLQNPGPLAQGWYLPQWAGPSHWPVYCLIDWGIFWVEAPSSPVTLACVNLT